MISFFFFLFMTHHRSSAHCYHHRFNPSQPHRLALAKKSCVFRNSNCRANFFYATHTSIVYRFFFLLFRILVHSTVHVFFFRFCVNRIQSFLFFLFLSRSCIAYICSNPPSPSCINLKSFLHGTISVCTTDLESVTPRAHRKSIIS